MIEDIIFDWSGTLFNNVGWFEEVCGYMFDRLGHPRISLDEIRTQIDIPYMKFWNHYFPDISKEEQDRLFREAVGEIPNESTVYPGVRETLEALREREKRLFILSSDFLDVLMPLVGREEVSDFFDQIMADAYDKDKKILELMEEHSCKPYQTAFVGDTKGDVLAGKKAGVRTVGISWGFQKEEVLVRSEPDYLIREISELMGLV